MADVFVISDLHLGHAKVAEYRGFATVEEHDAELVRNIRDVVKDRDQVIFCGDLAASSPTYALSVVAELPGEWHLVLGNHDKAHPMHTDAHRQQKKYLEVFSSVQTMMRRKIHGQTVLFSHFPYYADHTDEPRYMPYRLRDEGRLLVHGHLHAREKYTSFTELHVGVDAWDLAPVPYSAIQDWVAERIVSLKEQAAYGQHGSFG